MNYYNPYFYTMPTTLAQSTPKVGLLTRIFGKSGATLSSLLNGTQKILNVANQAIPLVKQARPIVTNAKTMFKIMNEFKRSDKSINKSFNNSNINNKHNNETTKYNYKQEQNKVVNGPIFFA